MGNGNSKSNQRIAQTLEALESRRNQIVEELEPRKQKGYRILSKIQNFGRGFFQTQLEKDYIQTEKLINNLVKFVRSRHPSETVFEELLERIDAEIDHNSKKISPSRLRIFYKIKDLISTASLKNVSNVKEFETNQRARNFIDDLRSQREIISEEFTKLLKENRGKENQLNIQSKEINRLHSNASKLQSKIADLQQEIDNLIISDRNKQNRIDEINEELISVNNSRFDLQSQHSTLQKQVDILLRDSHEKQSQIEEMSKQAAALEANRSRLMTQISSLAQENSRLEDELNKTKEKLLQIRQKYEKQHLHSENIDPSDALKAILLNTNQLEGDYIGILNDKGKKYHFNPKCPDWRSLVLEYLLISQDKRQIKNSKSCKVFKEAGLQPCKACLGEKKQNES